MKHQTGFVFFMLLLLSFKLPAQVSYNSAAAYSLRRSIPSYNGNAIQVRRTCDNAVMDIGFSCADLDTATLKTFVVAANPLNSISTSAAAAFSLRRLKCSYAGPAVQIRRSSDNATVNIGFTSWGDLDTATMKTFVGAGSAYVVTWYDQSGNGRNATQATNASQPRIMNAGVIERQGNMPAIRWLGLASSLKTGSFTAFGAAACYNGVARVNSNLSYNCIVNKCTANVPAPLDFYNGTLVSGNGGTYVFNSTSQTFNSLQPLGIWTYMSSPGNTVTAFLNSTSIASAAGGTWADNNNPLCLGSRIDGVTGLDGWISEVITFGALPSATDRNFLEWTQSAYYGISGPQLTPIPAGAPSAYISIWYDQSGNGFNITQTTTGNQPRIINAGVIEKYGTKAGMRFTGTSVNLTGNPPVTTYPVSISCLGYTGGSSTNGAFVKLGGVNGVNNTTSGVGIGVGASGSTWDNTGTSLIGLKEWVVWCPSSPAVNYPSTPFITTLMQQNAANGYGQTAFLNGSSVPLASSASTVGASITGSLYVGGYANVTNRYPVVRESEVILFASALNNTRRTLLETNQAAHYNVTITNSKYTPPTSTTYNLYVNGVGRESSTDSVNGTRSSAGMGFLVGTAATDFLKDNGDYITAGMNCPVSPALSVSNLPVGVVQRWLNDWYVNKTDIGNNAGNLSFYFNFGDYGFGTLPGVAANYRLLYRTSPAANFTVVPGTTPGVTGNRVQFLLDASNVITDYYYTIGTTNNTVSPLPVELTDFTAVKSGKNVNTAWHTASESNMDYFTVQRSANSVDFYDLGNVKAAGNSQTKKSYSYVDSAPLPGLSYYRLRQTELDKSFRYSEIAVIDFEDQDGIKVYPNPSDGNVTVDNCGAYERIIVMDALGRLVLNKEISNASVRIDLSYLRSGEYFLSATGSDGKKSMSKIIIRDSR